MHGEFMFLFVFLTLATTGIAYTVVDGPIDTRWAAAAAKLGLKFQSSAWFQKRRITGYLDRFAIELSNDKSHHRTSARMIISAGEEIDKDLTICAESTWTDLKKQIGGEDILVHDSDFDTRVYLRGNEPRILALLTDEARQAILDLLALGDGRVSSGMVQIDLPQNSESDHIVALAKAGTKVAAHLTFALPAHAVEHVLAANALIDRDAEVRRRNLQCLCAMQSPRPTLSRNAALPEGYARQAEVAHAARVALSETDPYKRLPAALLIGGEEGFSALKAIAEDDDVRANLRSCALTLMKVRYDWEKVAPTVAIAFRSSSEELLKAAVWDVGDTKALELFGSAAGELDLIRLLSCGVKEVILMAAEVLRQTGSIRAVEPLLRLADSRVSAELKVAARSAIHRIQGRLGDIEAGRLSLTEPEEKAGALSLAHEDGELSLAEKESAAGALSLPDGDGKKG